MGNDTPVTDKGRPVNDMMKSLIREEDAYHEPRKEQVGAHEDMMSQVFSRLKKDW